MVKRTHILLLINILVSIVLLFTIGLQVTDRTTYNESCTLLNLSAGSLHNPSVSG
jgi:hypothetical protein